MYLSQIYNLKRHVFILRDTFLYLTQKIQQRTTISIFVEHDGINGKKKRKDVPSMKMIPA